MVAAFRELSGSFFGGFPGGEQNKLETKTERGAKGETITTITMRARPSLRSPCA